MYMRILVAAGAVMLLQACSKVQMTECHDPFSRETVQRLFTSAVSDEVKVFQAHPMLKSWGFQPATEGDYSLNMRDVVQEKSETGYRCSATLEVAVNKMLPEMSPKGWLNPSFATSVLPVFHMDGLNVEPFSTPHNGNHVDLERAIVFNEKISNKDQDLAKMLSYLTGLSASQLQEKSDTAILLFSATNAGFDPVFKEVVNAVQVAPEDGNIIKLSVSYTISRRKVDGVDQDYLELEDAEGVQQAAKSSYILTTLSQKLKNGQAVKEAIVAKYDSEEKVISLFSDWLTKQTFYSESIRCGNSYADTFPMTRFRTAYEQGSLKFIDQETFQFQDLTCRFNEKQMKFVNEEMLPGAKLLVDRGVIRVASSDNNQDPSPGVTSINPVKESDATPTTTADKGSEAKQSDKAPSTEVAAIQGPSFDCQKASTFVEKMICSDANLSKADRDLADVYRQAADLNPDKAGLRKMMNEWRRSERDRCADSQCVLAAYAKQQQLLSTQIASLKR